MCVFPPLSCVFVAPPALGGFALVLGVSQVEGCFIAACCEALILGFFPDPTFPALCHSVLGLGSVGTVDAVRGAPLRVHVVPNPRKLHRECVQQAEKHHEAGQHTRGRPVPLATHRALRGHPPANGAGGGVPLPST